MLDYDGTLAPFRNNPKQAFPYPGASPLLQEKVRAGRTRGSKPARSEIH
jgi:trehalose-6-phosphatase